MSLIVLRNAPGSRADRFTCQFDKPIELREDSYVELVSCVFESAPEFEITTANNTCSYRLRKTTKANRRVPEPYVTATIPTGSYTISEMRLALERAMNAVIPESGASIHVVERAQDGLFVGFSIRFEVGFKSSPPSYDFDSTVVEQAQANAKTTITFKNVGAAGWDNKHAFSSEMFTRGRGKYLGKFPTIIEARSLTLSETPLQDGDEDSSPYASIGISSTGSLQYSIAGTQTLVPGGTWTPANNDIYGFYRISGKLRVVASTDGVAFTTLHEESEPPLYLYPGVIAYDKDCVVTDIQQRPDGSTYTDGLSVGTRADSDPYYVENPGGGIESGLGTIRRDGGGRIMAFDAGSLAETLGFEDGPKPSPSTNTFTWTNPNPIDPRAEHPALMLSLPQLRLESRNGANGLTGSILGIVPRLTAIANGNLVFEPRTKIPVRVSFARPTPINTITCEISQLDGTPASLRGVSVVTIWVS